MNSSSTARRWSGPPLALQIMGLLLGGLVVAQLVTLALTMLLPPQPPQQYDLADIARVLAGEAADPALGRSLQRVVRETPPQPSGAGWLTSERSRQDLARLVGRDEAEVRLYFYTPLPFAGTAGPPPPGLSGIATPEAPATPAVRPSPIARERIRWRAPAATDAGLIRVDYLVAQGGGGGAPGGGGRGPGGGFGAPGGFPQGGGMGTGLGSYPGGGFGSAPSRIDGSTMGSGSRASADGPMSRSMSSGRDGSSAPDLSTSNPRAGPVAPTTSLYAPGLPGGPGIGAMPGLGAGIASGGANMVGGFGSPALRAGSALAPSSTGPGAMTGPASAAPPVLAGGSGAHTASAPTSAPTSMPTSTHSAAAQRHAPSGESAIGSAAAVGGVRPAVAAEPVPAQESASNAASAPPSAPGAGATPSSAAPAPAATPVPEAGLRAAASPSSGAEKRSPAPAATEAIEAPASRGLFGLSPAPFVVGDFVAAIRLPQGGGWATVQPVPEPFPNAWQRRVLLWFVVAALVVAPMGWWFSRRLVRPIAGFARAAEQLGRDPRAPVLALEGPAEVGRAAQAFNRMQSRMRSFVDDRTAMIGAISHDMRTPLTRMRFRIEEVPEDMQPGLLNDVEEMERMISSVLSFIRNASEPGARERLDLSSIVEDVVEDAVFVGKDVRLERAEEAAVDVDAIGMRRVLDNLVENAVKYGNDARVRLFIDREDAVAEVSDSGPGLSDRELERVFEPFYRSPAARASGKQGSGLGLAVCRSIARAHGGDVQLRRGAQGMVAQMRLPLAIRFATVD